MPARLNSLARVFASVGLMMISLGLVLESIGAFGSDGDDSRIGSTEPIVGFQPFELGFQARSMDQYGNFGRKPNKGQRPQNLAGKTPFATKGLIERRAEIQIIKCLAKLHIVTADPRGGKPPKTARRIA